MPRIQPPNWQDDPTISELVAKIGQQRKGVGKLYSTLLNSPVVCDGWLHLGTAVRQNTFDKATHEIVVCYVGILNGAIHEVEAHTRNALREGFTQEHVDALQDWRPSDLFTPKQNAALAYAGAMTRDIKVPDEVFDALKEHFNARQIVELSALIGFYNMVSRFLVALAVE